MTAGAFDVMPDELGVDDFFSDGYIDFEATNIGAHMEFAMEFLPGFQASIGLPARLPSLSLGGINIEGMLQFGPVLDLIFPIGVALDTPVKFTTGFEVTAPPSLLIHLNISEPLSSEAKGFSDAALDALPFTADADGLAFDFFVGFRPKFRLNAELKTSLGDAKGGIGVYLDLPMLTASIGPIATPAKGCKAASSDETVYQLLPSISFGSSGVYYDLDTNILTIDTDYFDDERYPIYNATAIQLDMQCLKWDAEAKTLAAAAGFAAAGNDAVGCSSDRWKMAAFGLVTLFLAMTVM